MEVIVDTYGPEEQAMEWYYYLADNLQFPFKGRCIKARPTSPMKVREEVSVVRMAPEEDCMHEMFVEIRWSGRNLAVPLSQIEPVQSEDKTREAVDDWHYWVARGYELG
ncbi:MAG: calcium-binding protein [Chloroflexi bacterium]|nr:calcium-binding protein [Chloroflexota bacterium]